MHDDICTFESFINWWGDLTEMGSLDHKGLGALHPSFWWVGGGLEPPVPGCAVNTGRCRFPAAVVQACSLFSHLGSVDGKLIPETGVAETHELDNIHNTGHSAHYSRLAARC